MYIQCVIISPLCVCPFMHYIAYPNLRCAMVTLHCRSGTLAQRYHDIIPSGGSAGHHPPPLGCVVMRLYLFWHLESRWMTQWWTKIEGAGRLRWRCGAAWDSLWGWQGSTWPISSWQLQRLENHQMSSPVHIWMAAVTDEQWMAVCSLAVCVRAFS